MTWIGFPIIKFQSGQFDEDGFKIWDIFTLNLNPVSNLENWDLPQLFLSFFKTIFSADFNPISIQPIFAPFSSVFFLFNGDFLLLITNRFRITINGIRMKLVAASIHPPGRIFFFRNLRGRFPSTLIFLVSRIHDRTFHGGIPPRNRIN